MTTIKLQDENGTTTVVVGYVDVGGLAIPRAKLARELPDIERFEKHLKLALEVDAFMSEHAGYVPDSFLSLDDDRRREVAETMREVALLHKAAAAELQAEIEQRS